MTADAPTRTMPADLALVLGPDAWMSWVSASMGAGAVPRTYMVPPHNDVLKLGKVVDVDLAPEAAWVSVDVTFRAVHGWASEGHGGKARIKLVPRHVDGALRVSAQVEPVTVTEWHAWGLQTANGQLAQCASEALTTALEASLALPAPAWFEGGVVGVSGPDVPRLAPEVSVPEVTGTALVVGDGALRRLVAGLRDDRVDGQEVTSLRTRALEGGARGDLTLADGRTLTVTARWAPTSVVPVTCEGDEHAVVALEHKVAGTLAGLGLDAVAGRWRVAAFDAVVDALHSERWELVGTPGEGRWADGTLTIPLRVTAGRRRVPCPVSLVGLTRAADGPGSLVVANEQGAREHVTVAWARSAVAAKAMATVALPHGLPAELEDGTTLTAADAEALRAAGVA